MHYVPDRHCCAGIPDIWPWMTKPGLHVDVRWPWKHDLCAGILFCDAKTYGHRWQAWPEFGLFTHIMCLCIRRIVEEWFNLPYSSFPWHSWPLIPLEKLGKTPKTVLFTLRPLQGTRSPVIAKTRSFPDAAPDKTRSFPDVAPDKTRNVSGKRFLVNHSWFTWQCCLSLIRH